MKGAGGGVEEVGGGEVGEVGGGGGLRVGSGVGSAAEGLQKASRPSAYLCQNIRELNSF